MRSKKLTSGKLDLPCIPDLKKKNEAKKNILSFSLRESLVPKVYRLMTGAKSIVDLEMHFA